jgi:hypothetical protein
MTQAYLQGILPGRLPGLLPGLLQERLSEHVPAWRRRRPGVPARAHGAGRTRIQGCTSALLKSLHLPMPLALLLLMSLALLASPWAHAQRKSDVITLYNGDRITGEIKSLLDGRLSLSTTAMGTLSIEWRRIASIDSNYNYELRLSDGRRFFGTVAAGEAPGAIAFSDVFGEQALDSLEVVEIRPVEDEVLERLDMNLSLNYAFTKASGVRQTELIGEFAYHQPAAENTLSTRFTVSDTNDNNTTSSRIAAQRRTWTKRERVFRQTFAVAETNDELGLDNRVALGGGFGRFFVDTNNQTFSASLGLNAVTERSVGGDRQESLEAVISADFARWRFQSPKLDLSLTGTVYPSLTESGRVRSDTKVRLRWEIYDDLFWNINAWGSYDSEQIDGESSELDWGITTGLGWSF